MISSSRTIKLATLGLALTTHAALATMMVRNEAPLIEGSAGGAEVRLGNAFEDMAVGVMTEDTPDEIQPDEIEAIQPDTPAPEPLETPAPAKVIAADAPLVAMPEKPKEKITAAPEKKPEPPKEKPKKKKAQTKPQKTAKGNAKQAARAGEASGEAAAQSTTSGKKGSAQAGNAAVSNYPGIVMRKISRAGKPRVNSRGKAVVVFTISSSGGLDSVSLGRSSGNANLDQAALKVIRGAAPFPKPPTGAQRRFQITIQGR